MSRSLTIGQIAPLEESVPPDRYGGTERTVSALTEELVALGHKVRLFASGDSKTAAELVPVCAKAQRLDGRFHESMALSIDRGTLQAKLDGCDIVHIHSEWFQLPFLRYRPSGCLMTAHLPAADPVWRHIWRRKKDIPVVAISENQRQSDPGINWLDTVYHGIPADSLTPRYEPGGDYLAFLSRFSPEKGPDRAIEIARRSGVHIKLAGKVGVTDEEYFEKRIRPLLDGSLAEFMGEIDAPEKERLLGGARALIFPIEWAEPFGLCMVEAMACGTPVIAFSHGSAPEIVDEGITGFVVSTIDEAIAAAERVRYMDRIAIRRRFEERFSAARMARDYVTIYERLISERVLRATRVTP